MTGSITCPVCGMTSFHPDDIREGYCGKCCWWTTPDSLVFADRATVPGMTDTSTDQAFRRLGDLIAVHPTNSEFWNGWSCDMVNTLARAFVVQDRPEVAEKLVFWHSDAEVEHVDSDHAEIRLHQRDSYKNPEAWLRVRESLPRTAPAPADPDR